MRRRLFGGGEARAGRRRSSPYPTRTCHFCTLASTIVPPHPSNSQDDATVDGASTSTALPLSTGSVDNWFCSQCQCWNRVDEREEGGMTSWEQGMAAAVGDVQSKSARAAQPRHTSSMQQPAIARHNTAREPAFCHACQTNQMLLLSMSANYDGDKGIDDEAEQWRRYQVWRDELEARYPPVCADCQETVEGRIRMADQRARALIWNDLLRKRQQERIAQPHSSPLRRTANEGLAVNSSPATIVASPRVSLLPQHNEQPIVTSYSLAWYAAVSCFALSWLVEALLVDSVSEPTDRRLWLMLSLSLLHSVSLQWDPSVTRQIGLAKQRRDTRRVRITGMQQWRHALYILAAFRILHIAVRWTLAIMLSSSSSRSTAWITSLSFIALEAGGCMRAYMRVQVETPTRISLKSRSSLQTPTQRRNDGLDLTMLTLDQSANHRAGSSRSSDDEQDAEHEAAEDSMDWSPTLPATDGAASSFQLGPQRFFEPAKQTGLEELLANRLDLGHERAKPVSQASFNKSEPPATTARPMRIAALALVVIIAASTITAILASSSSPPVTILWTAIHTLRDRLASPWQAWWQRAQLLTSPHDDGGIWHAQAAARAQHQPAAAAMY